MESGFADRGAHESRVLGWELCLSSRLGDPLREGMHLAHCAVWVGSRARHLLAIVTKRFSCLQVEETMNPGPPLVLKSVGESCFKALEFFFFLKKMFHELGGQGPCFMSNQGPLISLLHVTVGTLRLPYKKQG